MTRTSSDYHSDYPGHIVNCSEIQRVKFLQLTGLLQQGDNQQRQQYFHHFLQSL